MSILRLKPACKDYLWGGNRLCTDFHIQSEISPLAEAWVLSCHSDGLSVIENGDFRGKTLAQYISSKGKEVLGKRCRGMEDFPILIKLIDAKSDLSVQVHPSDEYAAAHEGQKGKTELWYILDCEPDSSLYYGFRQPISRKEFQERIENGTLLEALNVVPVKKGDVFFIPSGMLHAIGKGIVLAEIQQNSNVTYRVYDYGRLGADGKPRELHISQALDVARCAPPEKDIDFHGHLAECEYFTSDLLEGSFSGEAGEDSFVSLLVVEGTGELISQGEKMSFRKGDSLFLPAGSGSFRIVGDCRIICTRV